jgi:hypothetical protein
MLSDGSEGSVLMRLWHRTASWRLRVAGCVLAALAASALALASAQAALPDGRAYEKVTPANKNGAQWGLPVTGEDLGNFGVPSFVVSRDGERVLAYAFAAFGEPDPGMTSNATPHVLERGADGWQSTPLPPAMLDPQLPPSGFQGPLYGPLGFTDDLSYMVFGSPYRFDARDADASGSALTGADVYGLRLDPTGAQLALLSCPAEPAPACAQPVSIYDAASLAVDQLSADGRVAVFETDESFAGADGSPLFPSAGGHQIYVRAGDELRWISQPLDAPEPAGASQVTGTPSTIQNSSDNSGQPNTPGAVGGWANAISSDGSRVFFASPTANVHAVSRVYVRVGDARTLEVSRVRGGDPTAQMVKFRGASADGNRALISTQQALLPSTGGDALATDPNASEDLYLWTYDEVGDPGNDESSALLRLAGLPQVGTGPSADGQIALSVIGLSDDATRVYFTTRTAASPFEGNLYLAELPAGDPRSGSVRWIAEVFTATSATATFGGCLNTGDRWSTCARATVDGRYLAFESAMPLTLDDQEPGCTPSDTLPAACKQDVFLYDAERHTLERASAGASAALGNGAFDATLSGGAGSSLAPSTKASNVSEHGEVFFVTNEPLNADDANGRQDVYSYSGESAQLISSGKSDLSSIFAGASNDGRSVFFLTAEGLVPGDTDGGVDFYAARVAGGFDRPAHPRCDPLSDSCQSGTTSPTRPLIATDRAGDGDAVLVPRARVTLRRPSAAVRRRAARTGVLRLLVRTTVPGRVSASARARVGTQMKLRMRTVASGSATAERATTVPVRLRLNRAARKRLRSRRVLRLSVRVSFPDAFAQSRNVVLRLPRQDRSGASSRQASGGGEA